MSNEIAQVYGSSRMFECMEGGNSFHMRAISCERIKASKISVLTLVCNRNLHNLHSRNGRKGNACTTREGGVWRLRFLYKWSKDSSLFLEWMGQKVGHIPSFLLVGATELQEKWKEHFRLVVEQKPRLSPLYFVNIVLPVGSMDKGERIRVGIKTVVNPFDGCISQSPDGPCCPQLPNPSSSLPFTNQKLKRGNRGRNRGCNRRHDRRVKIPWLVSPKTTGVSYDIVYFDRATLPTNPPRRATVLLHSTDHPDSSGCPEGWVLRWFSDVEAGNDLPIQNGVSQSEFVSGCMRHGKSMHCRLVHVGTNLRVQLCSSETHLRLKKKNEATVFVWGDGREALFSKSSAPCLELEGCTVSAWSKSDLVISADLSYSRAKEFYGMYKCGFGSRKRAASGGMNVYFGQRYSNRPRLEPFVGPYEPKNQQYYRAAWEDGREGSRMELESIVARLPIKDSALQLARNYCLWVGLEICDKLILTLGVPGKILSFVNETHRDVGDLFPRSSLHIWLDKLDAAFQDYPERGAMIEKLRESTTLCGSSDNTGLCCPTTCAYRHLWDGEHAGCTVHQFFDYPSFGIAQPIENGAIHFMLGSAFYHRTSWCTIEFEGKVYWMDSTSIPNFTLLGWGGTGGTPTQKELGARAAAS